MATISNNTPVKQENPKIKKEDKTTNDTEMDFLLSPEQLNNIHSRMLTEKEYNMLDDDKQTNYVRYNPTDHNILKLLKLAQSLGVMAKLLAPLFEILNAIPNPNPLQQLVRIMQLVNKFFDFIASIKSLKDVPVIGTLAAPVIDLFLVVWDIIVSIFLLIFSLFDGKLISLLRSEEFWRSIKEELAEIFTDGFVDFDSLKAAFQDKNFWEQMEMIIGKKEVTKIKQELIKIIKPMCDLIDEFKTIQEAMQQMIDMINQIHPLGDAGWGAALCKFLFDRTPKEMFQGSKELNKKMKGPLVLLDEIGESMEKITKSYYLTKEDYALITKNNKAKSEAKAEKDQKKNNTSSQENGIDNSPEAQALTNEMNVLKNSVNNMKKLLPVTDNTKEKIMLDSKLQINNNSSNIA